MASSLLSTLTLAKEQLAGLEATVDSLEQQVRDKNSLIATLMQAKPSKDIIPELTLHVLRMLTIKFQDAAFFTTVKDATEAAGLGAEQSHKSSQEVLDIRLKAAGNIVDAVIGELWTGLGVSVIVGEAELANCGFYVNDDRLSLELRQDMEHALNAFHDAESKLVYSAALGEEEYAARKRDQDEIEAVKNELEPMVDSASPAELKNMLTALQQKAAAVFAKLDKHRTSRDEFERAVRSLSEAERMDILRFKVFSSLTQGGGGGHSHNGVPCGGHGHAQQQPQQSHGHSHNGVPCGGHGHSHDHSHGQAHGHSHGDEPDEDFGEDDCCDDDDEGHGHSHDHGHSHTQGSHAHSHG